jgi:glycosyltransferase involved in cell wall biosynthesis
VVSGVGVVIRVRNAAPYVAEAVASVLDQTHPPAEVIIVDGGSTDGSIEALAPYASRIRVLQQRREGLGGAAQDGIDATGEPIIAFQDADDIWPPDRLRAMVDALSANSGWAGVMGRVEHFVSPDIPPEEAKGFVVPEGAQPGAGLPSLVLRRVHRVVRQGDRCRACDRARRHPVPAAPGAPQQLHAQRGIAPRIPAGASGRDGAPASGPVARLTCV